MFFLILAFLLDLGGRIARPFRCSSSKLCQGWRAGLLMLQLQFQQALLALPGMEGRVVAVAVPAGPACSARDRR